MCQWPVPSSGSTLLPSSCVANSLNYAPIGVTALCPGPTVSGFQAAASLEKSKLVARRTLPTSRDVAQAGYDALMAGTVVYIPGVSNKLTALSPRFFPRVLIRKIVRTMQERRS